MRYIVNYTVKKVYDDIDATKFNTAISAIMILVNDIYKVGTLTNDEYKKLLTIISPFAPHFSSELFEVMGYGKAEETEWPTFDASALVLNEIEMPIQVNGKVRGVVKVPADASQDEVLEIAKAAPEVAKYLEGNIVKVVYVPKKIVNIIVK